MRELRRSKTVPVSPKAQSSKKRLKIGFEGYEKPARRDAGATWRTTTRQTRLTHVRVPILISATTDQCGVGLDPRNSNRLVSAGTEPESESNAPSTLKFRVALGSVMVVPFMSLVTLTWHPSRDLSWYKQSASLPSKRSCGEPPRRSAHPNERRGGTRR